MPVLADLEERYCRRTKGLNMRCSKIKEGSGRCMEKTYADYSYCYVHLEPCPYHVVKERGSVENGDYKTPEICGKMPDSRSAYCPKHELMVSEEEAEGRRWSEKMQARKARKKDAREALETSPLAAVNPVFAESSHGTDPRGRKGSL